MPATKALNCQTATRLENPTRQNCFWLAAGLQRGSDTENPPQLSAATSNQPQQVPPRRKNIGLAVGTLELDHNNSGVRGALPPPVLASCSQRGLTNSPPAAMATPASSLRALLRAPRELSLVLACEFADSFSTFALDYVFVLYLSTVFGFSDQWAGWLYGLYGVMVLLYGIILGPVIDNLGVKRALVAGSVFATAARISLVFVTEAALLIVIVLALLPVGVAMTSNVLKLGIRRYTTKANRSMAFDCSYFTINCAALGSAILLTATRLFASQYGQYYRVYLLLAFGCCFAQVILAMCLREISVDEETEAVSEFSVETSHPMERYLYSHDEKDHNYDTGYPAANGANAPFELVLSTNPLLIMLLMPVLSCAQLHRYFSAYELLALVRLRTTGPFSMMPFNNDFQGSLVSALSMFVMVSAAPHSNFRCDTMGDLHIQGVSTSVVAAVVAVAAFTVGELIWAPRFLEMSVMVRLTKKHSGTCLNTGPAQQVGDEGKEGTVIALTGFPKFIARLVAGGSSGYLLQRYCPQQGICENGGMVWFAIGLTAGRKPLMKGD
ncbi:major facilitator family protein [Cystoisospora suis]|uniref:Major facilitator family protein n=1 Tax=Cystoisospora suis TaxID=483139 RepID=A0A2C6KLA8_9APIC|nr:major facilitator family protein [Cystoisospora suis]